MQNCQSIAIQKICLYQNDLYGILKCHLLKLTWLVALLIHMLPQHTFNSCAQINNANESTACYFILVLAHQIIKQCL